MFLAVLCMWKFHKNSSISGVLFLFKVWFLLDQRAWVQTSRLAFHQIQIQGFVWVPQYLCLIITINFLVYNFGKNLDWMQKKNKPQFKFFLIIIIFKVKYLLLFQKFLTLKLATNLSVVDCSRLLSQAAIQMCQVALFILLELLRLWKKQLSFAFLAL